MALKMDPAKYVKDETKLFARRNPTVLVELPVIDAVAEWMSCAKCKRIPLNGFFACSKDHFVCKKCVDGMGAGRMCPVALDSFRFCYRDVKEVYLGLLRKLYLDSKFACPNKKCKAVLSGREIGPHTEACLLRATIKCHFSRCKEKNEIILSQYTDHLRDKHHVPVFTRRHVRRCKIRMREGKRRLPHFEVAAVIKAYKEEFIITVEETEDYYFFKTYLIDARDSILDYHNDYRCRFEVTNMPDSDRIDYEGLRISGPVLPAIGREPDGESSSRKVTPDLNIVLWVDKEFAARIDGKKNTFWIIDICIKRLGSLEPEITMFPLPHLEILSGFRVLAELPYTGGYPDEEDTSQRSPYKVPISLILSEFQKSLKQPRKKYGKDDKQSIPARCIPKICTSGLGPEAMAFLARFPPAFRFLYLNPFLHLCINKL